MPGMSGLETLERLKAAGAEGEVILLTGQGTIQTAVQAMKFGAFDYLTKPFQLAELEVVIERAYLHRQLRKENSQLQAVLHRQQAVDTPIIGQSPAMQEVLPPHRAGRADRQGNPDSRGKRHGQGTRRPRLHRRSSRADKPLVVINCAALPETLLESELFGYEKGSFTGAVAAKPGLFEMADGGTLFIDEIGELAGGLQAKLLRVLEDGSMRRIGSVKERRVDVRLLAATNRSLSLEVHEGRFREDLYYRINVMSLELPPLRRRTGDIPLLVRHFLGPNWDIEPATLAALDRYSWPGNVRQLINAIERAKIMADSQTIHSRNLPPEIVNRDETAAPSNGHAADGDDLAAIQRAHIIDVLKREHGNKARAARVLGINRRSLYRLLEKHDIRQS